MRHVPLAVGILVLLTGCATGPRGGVDVLGQDTRGQVVFATTECVTPNSDGIRCDKKTCKKDQVSNCADFADKCLDNGHDYSGTNDAGTCTRVPVNHN
ncbi:MAG: hypothetical protein ACREMB_01115 [Candidatus Rokuibacteriota bacterium]